LQNLWWFEEDGSGWAVSVSLAPGDLGITCFGFGVSRSQRYLGFCWGAERSSYSGQCAAVTTPPVAIRQAISAFLRGDKMVSISCPSSSSDNVVGGMTKTEGFRLAKENKYISEEIRRREKGARPADVALLNPRPPEPVSDSRTSNESEANHLPTSAIDAI
jgi:hypothetical protein